MIREFQKQNKDQVDYLNCVGHPRTNSEEALIYHLAEDSFFQESIPPTSGLFLRRGHFFWYGSVQVA